MRDRIAFLAICGLLTACGTVDPTTGEVTSGPLGQRPLMTEQVKAAFSTGLSACVHALALNRPPSGLEARGFSATNRGYVAKIDNPNILLGGSKVQVEQRRDGCAVSVSPAFPAEINTVASLVRGAVSGTSIPLDATMRKSGDRIRVTLRGGS